VRSTRIGGAQALSASIMLVPLDGEKGATFMAATLSVGSGQSTNCSTITPKFADVANYRWTRDDPGESQRSCISAGLDQPSKIRLAYSDVANIFSGVAGLNPIEGQDPRGSSLLCQLTETWKVYDDADASAPVLYYPVSCHMVMKYPNQALVTGTVMALLVQRMLGCLYPAAATALSDVLTPAIRGVLKPY